MDIRKSIPSEILQVFWWGLSKEQQEEIVLRYHEEYNKFLNGELEGHLSEPVKKLININTRFFNNAAGGSLNIVKVCIEHGADIHSNRDRALRWAAQCGRLDIVKYLVDNGADSHANDDEALKWAAENGYSKVVEYLKSLG